MKLLQLTKGKFAKIDDEDYQRCQEYYWYYTPWGYAARSNYGSTIYLQCFILKVDKGVDHKDHDRLNCQKCNLRLATRSQNNANQRKRKKETKSKFKGVTFEVGRWRARLAKQHLGRFNTEEEAAIAYNIAAVKKFGEFSHLNKI